MDFIYGILLIITGIGVLKYRKKVHDATGGLVWAEQYLGRGGTHIVIILFAIGCIFLGVIKPFGGIDLFIK